jgi:NADH-quinone oxidoreductase subunit J
MVFYISAAVAVISTFLVITRTNAVHALLYLIVSLLSVAVIFFALGAPFIAALEVIIYAGAIMVLFIFVIMMLNPGKAEVRQERQWLKGPMWVGPSILAAVLLAEIVKAFAFQGAPAGQGVSIGPKELSRSLFGPYVIGVELASLILFIGLVGAFHLGRRAGPSEGEERSDTDSH